QHLFPMIEKIFMSPTTLPIRVACLICVHGFLKGLDQQTVVEKVVPMLKAGGAVKEAGLLLAILAVCEEVAKRVEVGVVAGEVLPLVWRMAVVEVLSVKQV
ncbi:hypothetical protein HDU98_003258, partial [Podochytrium sp. JEL0797]